MNDYLNDIRFNGVKPLEDRAHLAIATLHKEDEMKYINRVYDENYLTTEGANVNEMEATVAEYMSMPGREKKVVALCNGTSAIHLAVKLAAEKIYGSSTGISMPAGKGAGGSLYGEHVFVTDMTFDASVNPIFYEGWRACLY